MVSLVRSRVMVTPAEATAPVFPSTLRRSWRYFSKAATSSTLSSTGAVQSITNFTVPFFTLFALTWRTLNEAKICGQLMCINKSLKRHIVIMWTP